MPDARGNFKGVALNGKAGEAWDRIFGIRVVADPSCPLHEMLVVSPVKEEDGSTRLDVARVVNIDPAPEGAGSE